MIKSSLVSIIIVNFNGLGLLRNCLKSLEKNSYENTEIIIVDNGSRDGSIREIKNLKSKIKNLVLIENKKNLGFAEANNQAVAIANGELILLLNNDTIVEANFLKILVDKINNDSRIGVVQPKIIFLDTGRLQSGCAFLTSLGFLYYFGYGQNPSENKYNKSIPIFSANGACMLIRKKLVNKVNLFDKEFFAYYEETDFCHRVWLAGYKVIYEPASVIYHKGGQTSRKMPESFIFFHSFKNRLTSSVKNFELPELTRIVLVLIAIYLFLFVIYLVKLRFGLAKAIFNAILWNVININSTLKKRKTIQGKIRTSPDKAYLSSISRPLSIRYYLNMLQNKEVLFENEDYSD